MHWNFWKKTLENLKKEIEINFPFFSIDLCRLQVGFVLEGISR